MGVSHVLCLSLFISASLAAPSSSINADCKGQNTENLLEKHRHYQYSYHAEATAKSVGTTDLESKIDIKCDVHVQHASQCLYQMEVKDCKLNAFEVDGHGSVVDAFVEDHPLEAVTRNPISFTLNDGEIKSVFSSESDPLFSVNLKKGIASAFILRKSDLNLESRTQKVRVDVQGTCPVEISSPEPGKALLVKDMGGCHLPTRKDYHLSPLAMFWNMSFIQHVINSTEECRVAGNDQSNAIQSVQCRERHAIKLESTQNTATAVQTVIKYSLTLTDSQKNKGASPDLSGQKESSIIFEYEENSNSFRYNSEELIRRTKEELAAITQLASEEIHVDSIRQHHNLVGLLRSSQDSLDEISDSVIAGDFKSGCTDEEKEVAMDLYQFALVQCNTVPCMRAFADLVEKKLVQHVALNFVYMSLTNIHHLPPEYIGSVLKMCAARNDRFCYTTLGALVSKYNDEQHLDQNSIVPKEILDAVTHLSATIGNECSLKNGKFPPGIGIDKQLDYMMTIIKSVGNMGEVYRMAEPEVVEKLARCARNKELSPAVAVSAVEAFRKMSPTPEIGTVLLDILKDESATVELRLAAYEVLIVANFNSNIYRQTLISLLKNPETNSQIRGYLANEFKLAKREGVIKDAIPESHRGKRSLPSDMASKEALGDFDLNSIPISELSSSRKRLREESVEIEFLPEGFDVMGGRLESEVIFNTFSSFPESVRANLTTELFGKVFQLLEVGVQTGGWENVISQIKTMILTLKEPTFVQYTALIMQTLAQNRPTAKRRPSNAFEPRHKVLLEKTIEESIEKLRSTYKTSQKNLPIYFVATLRMLGNDLGFISYEDIFEEVKRVYATLSSGPRKSENRQVLSISETRVLDVIEAYHQFPTIMGLPLNWTTNASLAFSVRGGLKMSSQQAAIVHLYPTAALTFLNRMVLDLPTVTNIGVQANSSAYHATEYELTFSLTRGLGGKVSMKADDKIHKPLELFRTNQMIKGGRYVNIEDHDIQRVTEKDCSPGLMEEIFGQRCCLERSYANVTHLDKPFFPLAANAHLSFTCQKADPELTSYTADMLYETQKRSPEKKFKLELTAPGANGVQRHVPIHARLNTDTKEFSLEVTHSDRPDFHLRMKREKTADEDHLKSYRSTLNFAVQKGKELEIIYEKQQRREERGDVPANRNVSPKSDSFVANVNERTLKVKSPYNHYHVHSAEHHNPDNDKVDVHLTYENKDPEFDPFGKILPKIFFDKDNKASIRYSATYRHLQRTGKGGLKFQSTSHLSIPTRVLEVTTHALHENDRIKMKLNATETEIATGDLLLFVNASVNLHRKSSADLVREVADVDVKMPRHSLSGHAVRESHRNGAETLHLLEVTAAKTTKEGKPKEYKAIYEQKLKHRKGNDDDLTDTVKAALETEFEAVPGHEGHFNTEHNHITVADIRLSYPFYGKQEVVDFNGTFKYIVTTAPTQYTFAKDFVMQSSLNNLRLDSTSGFVVLDKDRSSLVHSSHLTNIATGKNQGNYNLRLQSARKPGLCAFFKMSHKIDAPFSQMSSNIDLSCDQQSHPIHTLLIDIDNVSPYLKELDFKLKQIFKGSLDGNGEESMNLTGTLMDIAVTGRMTRNPSHYKKRVTITSKMESLPSVVIELEGDPRKDMKVVLQGPETEKISRVTMRRDIINDGTGLDYSISHNEEGSSEERKDFDARLQIISPHEVLVSLKGSTKIVNHLGHLISEKAMTALDYVLLKVSDGENELNQNLSPLMGEDTILGYAQTLGEKFDDVVNNVRDEIEDSATVLKSSFEPVIETLTNAACEAHKLYKKIKECLKTKTLTGRLLTYLEVSNPLLTYFEVSDPLQKIKQHVAELITENNLETVVVQGLDIVDDYKFKEIILHPFTLESLYKMPSINAEVLEISYPILSRVVSTALDTSGVRRMPQVRLDEKMAMIFGPSSVLTFDGKLYRAPSYPSEDCAFLLAHDVRGKSFSLLTTKNKIHAIFPEMSISIDGEGHVFVNATPSDSSKPRALPISSSNNRVTVSRQDSDTIAIKSPTLKVQCVVQSFECVVLLGNLHQAGTIGLLGNADGEPENDFQNAKGERLSDPVQVGHAYELSRQPICQRLYPAADSENALSEDATSTCKKDLAKTRLDICAPLARVHKEEVRSSCAYDVATNSGNLKAKCATIEAMVTLCSYHNIRGQGCAHCEGLPENHHEKNFVKHATSDVDLVLIVEENSLVLNGGSSSAIKGLETLIGNIEEVFQGNGYSDFRLAVVGFGGKEGIEQKPHLQTLGGSPFMAVSDLPEIIKTLKFDGTTNSNLVEAVRYANDALNFRPTASKVFILFANNEVEDKDNSPLKQIPARVLLRQLSIVSEELDDNGITLYTFSQFPTIDKGKKVYGLRSDGLIFPHNAGEDVFMNYPKTLSAKLTSGTRGSIFLSSFVEENKNAAFFYAVSEEVAAKVGQEKSAKYGCKKCHCSRNFLYHLRTHCQPAKC